MGESVIFRCVFCGAADSRDEAHQGGCPRFPELSKAEMIEIARNCERLWADDGMRRAELEQERAREAHVAEIRREAARARLAYRELREARRRGAA